MGKDAQGVIFVYSKKTDDNIRDLEKFYDYFVTKGKLEQKNCVVFYFDADKSPINAPKRICNKFITLLIIEKKNLIENLIIFLFFYSKYIRKNISS